MFGIHVQHLCSYQWFFSFLKGVVLCGLCNMYRSVFFICGGMKKSDVMACLGCMFFVFTFFGWLSLFDYRPGLHSLWIITYKGRLVTTLMLSKREYEDVINNMVQFYMYPITF